MIIICFFWINPCFQPCARYWKITIPDKYISRGRNAKKTFHLGNVNLEVELDGEERDCIHWLLYIYFGILFIFTSLYRYQYVTVTVLAIFVYCGSINESFRLYSHTVDRMCTRNLLCSVYSVFTVKKCLVTSLKIADGMVKRFLCLNKL